MKKNILIAFFLILTQYSFGQKQTDKEIILLAEIYHNYHWRQENTKVFTKLNQIKSNELIECKSFIEEIIKSDNDILSTKFIKKPTLSTLKNMYIIVKVNYNMFEKNPTNNSKLISTLKKENIDKEELLTFYYRTIFGSLVNKNPNKDFSHLNFKSEELNLNTETEKAIFILVAMERFGAGIWGYMNIANKNCEKTLEQIKRWPQFDGKKFDSALDFSFNNFKIEVDKREPKVNFKEYYLDKLNQTIGYYNECRKE